MPRRHILSGISISAGKRNASHLRRGRGSVKSAMRKRENKTESTTGYRRELWAFST